MGYRNATVLDGVQSTGMPQFLMAEQNLNLQHPGGGNLATGGKGPGNWEGGNPATGGGPSNQGEGTQQDDLLFQFHNFGDITNRLKK